jgi:hypothetical protein
MNAFGIDSKPQIGGEGFSGDFQKDTFEDWCRHGRAGPSLRIG